MKKIDFSENRVHMVKPFNPYYIAEVLADIWGRENGCKLKITLTPKETNTATDTKHSGDLCG